MFSLPVRVLVCYIVIRDTTAQGSNPYNAGVWQAVYPSGAPPNAGTWASGASVAGALIVAATTAGNTTFVFQQSTNSWFQFSSMPSAYGAADSCASDGGR